MMLDNYEDYLHFQKIRKQRKNQQSYRESKFEPIAAGQLRGTVHKAESNKFFPNDTANPNKMRPGAIVNPPAEPGYETGVVPFSARLHNRSSVDTVFLDPTAEPVDEPCYALLSYFKWFVCTTLVPARGTLSDAVMDTIESKLKALV